MTSRIFPLVFGATAESSPSMRPLSGTMLAGRLGVAKNISHTASATITSRDDMRILLRRVRGSLLSTSEGELGAWPACVRCSTGGGSWAIVFVFISSMAFSVPHFLQVRERKIRNVVRDAVQLTRREFQFRLQS